MTRPYVRDDAASVAHLLNEIEIADGAQPQFTEAYIRDELSGEIRDPVRDTRLVFAPDGTLAAFATVRAPPPGGSRARMSGAVHPDWRGRGIGRVLLTWQFDRITEMRAQQDPGTAWRVGAGASSVDESAARLFRRFDLRPARYFLEMSALTAGAPSVRPPDGIRIVEFTGDLGTALYAAHTEAFADLWGSQRRSIEEWTAVTIGSESFRGDLSRIALDGDEIAAYLLGYDGLGNRLYIGQVGTRRKWRKQGLATALLAASLAASAKDGKPTASLGVDADSPTGAVGVYERLGFMAQHSPYIAYDTVLAS